MQMLSSEQDFEECDATKMIVVMGSAKKYFKIEEIALAIPRKPEEMEKINFTIDINAPKEKVWKILWDKPSYEKWTTVFAPGSTVTTDWKEGSKVLFGDGKGNGMVSRIAEKKENEYMSFEHLGESKDGVEDTTSDAIKAWAGSHENYRLTENNSITKLDVDMDIAEDFKEMFMKMWPTALETIKTLSEN